MRIITSVMYNNYNYTDSLVDKTYNIAVALADKIYK